MAKLMIDKAVLPSAAAEKLLLELKDRGEIHERFPMLWRAVMPPGEEPPDLNAILEFLARGLRHTRVAMVAAADTREREIAEEGELRTAAAAAQARLTASYVDARSLYTFIYGRSAAQFMGFATVTKQQPARLARRVARVLGCFRKLPDAIIPAPAERSGFAIKPSLIIDKLEAPHKALRKATRRMAVAALTGKLSVNAKRGAYYQHAGCLSTHTLCAEVFCRMVGLEEEASRIRSAKRAHGETEPLPSP